MKKIFGFVKKKKGPSSNASDSGSVFSVGYDLKEKDLGKLHKAAVAGDLAKLKQLIKKNDINQLDKENRTPLHLACAQGHAEVVRFLLDNKAKLNLCDNDNRTPLMKAVQCQQERCAVYLLELNADPNLVDADGNTALHLAAMIPDLSLATHLLEHDAHVNASNKEGFTPLILAVAKNHQEMAEFLLKEGANVDSTDSLKRTALMFAANNGQINMVRLLLRYNADISVKEDKGWTAEDYAVMNGHHACSHLIIEHGTKKRSQQPVSYGDSIKGKGASFFSSPVRSPESGFTLGEPATDKEEMQQAPEQAAEAGDSGKGADDDSQAESISRASNRAGDSWASSDEDEDFDFSPKKPQRPNLTKLMNSSQKDKKNVFENAVTRNPRPVEQPEPSKLKSNEDSKQKYEDDTDHSLPKALSFSAAPVHPAVPSNAPISKHPMTNPAPVKEPKKKEATVADEEEEEEEEEDDDEEQDDEDDEDQDEAMDGHFHNTKVLKEDSVSPSSPSPKGVQLQSRTEDSKRDFLSELGLEVPEHEADDDNDSPWDSESASDSPRKIPTVAKSQAVMSMIAEETNEDRSEKLREKNQMSSKEVSDVRSPPISKEMVEKQKKDLLSGLGLEAEEDNDSPWDSESDFNSPRRTKGGLVILPLTKSDAKKTITTQEKKEDVFEELGLNDADDIEDASDWDSVSTTSKNLNEIPVHSPGQEVKTIISFSAASSVHNVKTQSVGENEESLVEKEKENNSENHHGIKDDSSSDHLELEEKQENDLLQTDKIAFEVSPIGGFLRAEHLTPNEEEDEEGGSNIQVTNKRDLPNENDLDIFWEKRYEKIWVEREKREVKSQYRNVTAELKEKFGEIALKQPEVSICLSPTISVDDDDCHVHSLKTESKVNVENVLLLTDTSKIQSILELSKPRLENTNNGPSPSKLDNSCSNIEETKFCNLQNSGEVSDNSKKTQMPNFTTFESEIQPTSVQNEIAGYDTDLDSDSAEDLEEKLTNKKSGCTDAKNNSSKEMDSEHLDCVDGGIKNPYPLDEDKKVVTTISQPIHVTSSKYPSDEQLKESMEKFKNEVGMLKVVFLTLKKDKVQLQKEVERKQNKLSGEQKCNIIKDYCESKTLNGHIPKGINLTSDEEDIDNPELPRNELNKTGKLTHKTQLTNPINGEPLSVFDDSTLSEVSEDGGRPIPRISRKNKNTKTTEIENDFDDFTQSSDTATEELEMPVSGCKNASLMIKQLDSSSIDHVALVKIQNVFHEYERTIEREKGRYALQSDKVKQLENENKKIQRSLEETRDIKSMLEHKKVEWETDQNNLKFVLKQEQEKHKNAQMLYEKSREQLKKKEEQYCKEVEGTQQLELTLRNMEMEMKALLNKKKELEDERDEAQRLLSQERSARSMQEGILNNHLRRQKEIEQENKVTLTKSTEVFSPLSEVSDKEKDLAQQNSRLQEEIAILKLELEKEKTHSQAGETKYLDENEALKEKVEDLKQDLKLNEEALAHTVFQYTGQISTLKTENTLLTTKLEHEKQAKDKLEVEVESVHTRLASAIQELERNYSGKANVERALQQEKGEIVRLQEKSNSEMTKLQESINSLSQQLSKAELKANCLENECHRATLSLTEKTVLFESTQREKEQVQSRLKETENLLQIEKEQLSKSLVRQESMQERLAQAQSENMLLRQQLDEAQNKGLIKERVVNDVQDRFNDILTQLRADTEDRVHMIEERNKEVVTKNNELNEKIQRHESEKVERETTLRQLQQELADALKKLSMSEASLEVNIRYRSDLEEEKIRLQKDIERLKGKLQEMEDQYVHSERRSHDLKNALEDKEREVIASSQKLQEMISSSSGTSKTMKQLEEHTQRLEIENARLEAAAKQQTTKIDALKTELQESISISDAQPEIRVRNRLEEVVTNLQGSKISLEEQLNREVQKQNMLSHNAQDSHLLWEEELKSRSKLGIRLTQLEREKSEMVGQVETEKKRIKKISELKRSVETRLDQEMKRNSELQKELNRMRTLAKTAKKKLKEQENGEFASQISSIRGEFNFRHHHETESTVGRMKSKMDELSQQLENESVKCRKLESTNRDLQEQLSSMKTLHKSHEKLEKNKRQLEEEVLSLRHHLEMNITDQSQMEHYKREVEERARQDIRQKLEEVNLFLQTQAASQEALEQIKATNEATLRNQLEQRIKDLESELSRIKNTHQENMNQRDSTQTELERYKELYAEELKLRKSLAAKLDRSNERLAEANTKLLNERQRSKSLIASNFLNGSLSASPTLDMNQLQGSMGNFGGTSSPLNRSLGLGGSFLNPVGESLSQNSKVEAYIAKMQSELEKSITKELEQATAELNGGSMRMSPVGSAAGSKSSHFEKDPVTRATQQYLEVLKKNYMI
ncbi:ankyrin repeat domain-containing protein 26 isoform X2 [Erpetoichthys calabaricus]|uniref:ankyrin repeat domain-containing protein 26 isoform X2 n=1 Tax=Erpetoichthys calabaricus TaxID=27687 RepID=UPI0022344A21|nr:ankyrin repeat domain-containing protein 26 isoform X2 [Erpetoichthys calabaricus]